MRITILLTVLLFASSAQATDQCFKHCGGGSGAGGGVGGGLARYVETTSPTAGSTPSNTGDDWIDTTNHTIKWSESGLTEAWQGTPITLCGGASDATAVTTSQDFVIGTVPWDATVTRVQCIVVGGTSLTIAPQECTNALGSCADTEAAMTCDADGVIVTSIDDPNVDRDDLLKANITAASGSSVSTTMCVTIQPR